ncbi:MAG: hypothetical protein UT34_C0001G0051 [candidate division WS6 bacterium GW2011_GWF2_39_15]|uniref:Two component transcriptional regulator, winged helix family n=1 Tax=candidate division WS6 bacterium GW2011_GWF2_39_15 TaxID=1619100 RepID=A0A0G0MZH9_9BACT|nr:MAG: hypothetical protein UT34_C0001G0051 [candidate division WS6 bacterium GW2011_GWF2_39_15]
MKVLIIEDEDALRKPIRLFLENKRFEVDEAEDGKIGLEMARISNYDCIILDLNLPEIDGVEVCKRLRDEKNTTPIIMATARSQIYNKLEGFETGADDYMTKPFNLEELVARIKAVIKRNSLNKSEALIFGQYTIHPESNLVISSNSREIMLSNKEMGILEYLLRNKGRIVSSEELLEHVWSTEVDTFTQTVKTHIKTLRKKVDTQKELILSVKGKGYIIR